MPDTLTFREVTAERWSDLERLFEARGGPKYCWCMLWRPQPAGQGPGNDAKKAALERSVRSGMPVGILGYLDEEPVAWCSIAPRETYRNLGGMKEPGDAWGSVWSLACFFVPRRLRGQGVSKQLLEAAVKHAADKGAAIVEAYPVDPDSPSYGFMGRVPAFQAAGFQDVGAAGKRRHVMRLKVG